MLDQPYMTDLIEANSMGHEPHKIHIYSASWGPTDDGRTVDGPRNATMRAIVRGVNESCSSTLASTFSNGARDPSTGVATTDLYGKCTATHSGTSAAAPEAAGVFALALHANEIPSEGSITLRIETTACGGSGSEVRYLEHVQAVVSANASRRGDLELFLTSPMGTKSMILSRRANDDDSRDGFAKWPFMTTHTWGEYPQGTWTLEARFNSNSGAPASGWLRGWSLVLHGSRAPPYAQLQPQDPHSKLAVVKKAHEDAGIK
ncbi:hypothetical protein MSG28_007066 [Choristoneura fumiferana]|uniref:Uncharacterized protein n=1 Tax=Choristoneura fumiferana TaxID=7141 RepID=A0ACC0JM98_CHOFU|nr:hypothetical protein MSG28_007066 [Choristoneura fumiferana]